MDAKVKARIWRLGEYPPNHVHTLVGAALPSLEKWRKDACHTLVVARFAFPDG